MSRTVLILLLTCGVAVGCAAGEGTGADYRERMEREHADDRPTPGAAAGDPARQGVTAADVAYWPGAEIMGYLAQPAAGPARGGIIVIQEWWGLNDNIRTMARRFAQQGYAALAVDLYEGNVATTSDEARGLMRHAMERSERLEENLRAAHAYLESATGVATVGSVGWCFGGGWSLRTAILLGDELDAAVIYYGRVVSDDQLATIGAPVLGHFGSEDRGIPLEGVRAFESRMHDFDKEITVHIYEGANHAFANPSGTRYDEDAATQAWTRTLEFFAVHLDG
ncbi:MAG: dienelactone hydrolase family protein [Acidobacteria bacterium]|nr:dienelactone hydrolase family protein [Acidobacteriota bacterium]